MKFIKPLIIAVIAAVLLDGCTIHPMGEREERESARLAGKTFEKPIEKRNLPPLPENPSPEDLVHYALLANADLEAHYWQWRAAIEQIPQDATQTTTLNVALGTTFTKGGTGGRMTTLALGNDPMTDIKWPGKLDAAGRVTLENARAAGVRFRRAQFDLRAKVLAAYYDYALTAELIRLEESNQQLLETTAMASDARNRAGAASQQDVIKARNEVDLSKNNIANMKAQLSSQRAALNAHLNRPANAPLPAPGELPASPPLTYGDDELLALVARRNPELRALAAEARGRTDAIQLARLQYFPDFNLSVGTDLAGIVQSVLAQATVPILRYEALNAAIAQAEANARGTDAMRRQAANDLASRVVLDISTIHAADRQIELFEHTILPRARQIVVLARNAYEAGQSTLLELLDSQRLSIAMERLVADLRTSRDKRLADLEAIAALDLEKAHGGQAADPDVSGL